MAEDTPESNPEEDDVEAEMLRMMQEEIAGEGGEGGEGGGEEADGEDDAFAAMAAALGGDDEGGDGAGNIDAMLEEEMLKAMQTDTEAASSGAMAPMGAMGHP